MTAANIFTRTSSEVKQIANYARACGGFKPEANSNLRWLRLLFALSIAVDFHTSAKRWLMTILHEIVGNFLLKGGRCC
jgi:hypothetical protein